jgi:hypothetical protein
MEDTSGTCDYLKDDGEPCELPASRDDGRCHFHTEIEEQRADTGRPRLLDDERKQQIIYTAVNSGLTIEHQANLAQVSPDTLRRALCCVETPRDPQLTTEEPCEFCEGYAQAHARGAMDILQECRPEFRASATFGYTKTEEQKLTGDGENGGIIINMGDDDE